MIEELKLYQDIDINFTRLLKPKFNSLDLPLSGLYNDLNNNEYPNFPLKNKFNNFTSPFGGGIGLENLFLLKNYFGKLITEETLEGLIILTNNSTRDIIIKNLEITLNFDTQKKTLTIPLPDNDNTLSLSQNKSYSIKIKNHLKKKGKYAFDVKFVTKSGFYDQQYYSLKQRYRIKESNKYKIIDNHVEYYNNKIFSFNVNDPFDIKTKFKMNKVKEGYFIELNIKNITNYYLTIPDLIIKPKQKNNIFLKPISTLEEMQLNYDGINIDNINKNDNFLNNTKIISLQPDEELNLLFKSSSKEIFLFEEKFIVFIKWLNIFDFSPKNFEYEFKNELDIFNEYFFFLITERPLGNIILGDNFPVIFQFINKQPSRDFELTISEYNEDKKDDEVDIIIKEYQFELNEKCQKYDINIKCKSDKTGFMKFPDIIVKLKDKNKNEILGEYIYKSLMYFNCIENVQLI